MRIAAKTDGKRWNNVRKESNFRLLNIQPIRAFADHHLVSLWHFDSRDLANSRFLWRARLTWKTGSSLIWKSGLLLPLKLSTPSAHFYLFVYFPLFYSLNFLLQRSTSLKVSCFLKRLQPIFLAAPKTRNLLGRSLEYHFNATSSVARLFRFFPWLDSSVSIQFKLANLHWTIQLFSM